MRAVVTGLSRRAVHYLWERVIGGGQAKVSSFGPSKPDNCDYAEIEFHPEWLGKVDWLQRNYPGIRILVIPEDPRNYVAWIEKEVRETGRLVGEIYPCEDLPELIRDRFDKIYFGGEELVLDRFKALQDVFDRPVGGEDFKAITLESIQEGEGGKFLSGFLKCGVEASKLPQDKRIHWSDYMSRFSAMDVLSACPGIAMAMGLVAPQAVAAKKVDKLNDH